MGPVLLLRRHHYVLADLNNFIEEEECLNSSSVMILRDTWFTVIFHLSSVFDMAIWKSVLVRSWQEVVYEHSIW